MNRAWPMRWWITAILIMVAVLSFVTLLVGAMVREVSDSAEQRATDQWQVRQRLVTQWRLWRSVEWQGTLLQEIAAIGADVRVADQQGETLFESGNRPLSSPGSGSQAPGPHQPSVRRVEVTTVRDETGTHVGTVYFYGPWDVSSSGNIVWSQAFLMFGLLIGGVVLSSLIASWIFSRVFLSPLRGLVSAAEQVRQGNFGVELKAARVHEVAVVLDAFQKMTQHLSGSIALQNMMEEERRFFMASISHDLRTPLFSIRGRLEGLRDGLAATPEQMHHYVSSALRSLDALDRLVADLFAYAKLNLFEQSLMMEPVDLPALLKRAVEDLQPRAEARKIALVAQGLDRPCLLSGDPHFLHRAFSNLLDNALYYSPNDGRIWVQLAQQGGTSAVQVCDSGPGFPEDLLPHLFSPLHRGEASRSRKTGGAGLGLAIARRVFEAHGGTIRAGNREEGGACIFVTLPIR